MKRFKLPSIALRGISLLLFLCSPVQRLTADVIYLTDGNVLLVEKAWIEGEEVKYQTSRGIQSLPKSRVREIQGENLPPAPKTPQRWSLGSVVSASVPAATTGTPAPDAGEFSAEALRRLRQNLSTNPTNADARFELIGALNSIAWLQVARGDLPGARVNLEEALSLDKRDAVLVTNLAVIHLRMSNYRDAETLLRSHLSVDRNNQEAHYLLGESYYGQEKIAEAIDEWNAGLRLGPHADMSKSLEKAQKELRIHDQLGELLSTHFILRYDRKVSNQQLGQQILATLEALYSRLTTDLMSRPPATIAVILYPDQTFFDITRAASWSGAMFDGKIRVPTKGLTSVTPALRAILIHELTHAFIAALPQDCPAWFNEGVAQLQEGESAAPLRRMLEQLRQTGRLIPLRSLPQSFTRLTEAEADIAYAEALSATEYLVKQHGKASLRSILELMAQNNNFENAFTTTLRKSLTEFESAWLRDLKP